MVQKSTRRRDEDAGSAKDEALKRVLEYIEKQHGVGSIMRLNERVHLSVPAIPTGALTLDHALGVGGLPRGRVVEIFGPESSGKTTLALHVAANAQKAGGVVAYIDAEHALDPSYAKRLGVNIDELLISQPNYGEQALEIADTLVQSGAISVVVIDSVASLVPKAELDGEMMDMQVGLQARLMSKALRKLTGSVATSNTCLIFINQLRMNIGVKFGSPETTTGGRALRFYSSVRIDIRRTGSIKIGEEAVGNLVHCKIVKNKVAPPFRVADFEILFNHGISQEGVIIDLGLKFKLITKAGSWFSYGETRLGQGRENVREALITNKAMCAELEAKVRELLLSGSTDISLASSATSDASGDSDEVSEASE
ncbi:MAG: recombinase RecA [Planctomycetota bacterium]